MALGTYRLEFLPLPGYLFSPQDQGGHDALDSDADSTTGRTHLFTVPAGLADWTCDVGMWTESVGG